MYVAQRPEQLCTIAEVAAAYGISEAHLMKITHQLYFAGFIETVRGKGGGMRLARAPGEINLGAVVRSVEPDFNLVECLATGNTCTLTGQCRLTAIVSGALRQFSRPPRRPYAGRRTAGSWRWSRASPYDEVATSAASACRQRIRQK